MKNLLLAIIVLATGTCIPSMASGISFRLPQDTTDVTRLIVKGNALAKTNFDSASFYYEQSLAVAESADYPQGIMRSNLAMAALLIQHKQRARSRDFMLSALDAARTLKLIDQQISILTDIGNQSYRVGEYSISESYYQQAITLAESSKLTTLKIKNLTNLGMAYTKLRDYPKAFDSFTLSNKLADSLDLKEYIGGNYIDIAIILQEQKKFDESLEYYRKAVDVFHVIGDSVLVNYAEFGIAETFMKMGNYHRAITFLQSMRISPDDNYSQFTFHHNLGISYRAVKKWRDAEASFLKAQQINDELIRNPFHTVQNNIEFARLLLENKRYEQGITLVKSAEALSKDLGVLTNYKEALYLLTLLHEKNGDGPGALRYMKQYSVIQDSISKKDKAQTLAEAETRFRLGEMNREVTLLEKENELQKQRERFSQSMLIVLTGSVVVLIIASAVALRQYRRARNQNQLLAQQKDEIESANALITEQARKLREVDSMKTRFFANISHELRTPVTLITGMLEFIREGKGSLKEKERVNVALGNSRKLNSIIEEMLDLTRLEANKIVLKKEVQAAQPLLNRIVGAFDSLATAKGIRLMTDHVISQPLYIDVDQSRFEKIFNNLIYNAVKFTPSGGWIRIRTMLSPDKQNIDIQVSDSGRGIPPEDIPYIFDRFYQSQSAVHGHDTQGGTGIGLSLAREFTLLHGGDISVDNGPGEGAVFSLRFPLVFGTAITTEPLPYSDEETFTWKELKKRPSVLLVEDHEDMRNYVSDLLGDHCVMQVAAHGAEALEKLSSMKPDLIISDVMMPVMDGFTFLNKLKSNESLNSIPVIMLTARAAEEDKLQGLTLGVDDYIVKPFHALELKIRVQNLLQNQERRKEWLLRPKEQEEIIPEDTRAQEALINSVKEFVETNIENPSIGVPELARHLGMSERQLYRKTGELTGLAPAQLVKEIRLKKAYQLLMERKVSKIAELAMSVGYESPAYFSRQFAEQFGKRPSEFL